MSDSSGVHHDPDGPVVVMEDVPLALVRRAVGSGRWISRPGAARGWAAVVARSQADIAEAASVGVPAFATDDDASLVHLLQAFDDGVLITPREAELLSWIDAIRAEEARVQADSRLRVDQRVEALQSRIDQLEGHLRAIEESRAWHLSRRLVSAKARMLRALMLGRRT